MNRKYRFRRSYLSITTFVVLLLIGFGASPVQADAKSPSTCDTHAQTRYWTNNCAVGDSPYLERSSAYTTAVQWILYGGGYFSDSILVDGVFGSFTQSKWHDYEINNGLGGGYIVDGTGLSSEWTWLKDNALVFQGYSSNNSYWQAVGLTGRNAYYRYDYANSSQYKWYVVRSGNNPFYTPVDTTP